MTTEFSYLTFSVFEISDFNLFVDTVKVIFKKQLITGKAEIYSEIPNPNGWVNPQSGGSHFPKFSCWQNKIYPDKVFFISNYEDGLSNVCRIIAENGGYPPTQNGDIRSLFWLFSLMALQN